MNSKALYREIGLLDDALVAEAEQEKPRGAHRLRWLSMAACFALVLAAAAIWQSGLPTPTPTTPGVSPPATNPAIVADDTDGTDTDPSSLTLNHATTAMAASRVIEGHFWQTLTEAELAMVFPAAEARRADYEITATANFSQTDNGIRLVDVAAHWESGEGITAQVTASPDEIMKCYLLDGEPVLSEIGGVCIDAGYFDDTNDGSVLYYADFKLDDVYYSVQMRGGKADQAVLSALLDHLIRGGKADFSAITPNPPPVLRNDSLTLQEARCDEAFGVYIPQQFPDGFAFSDANRFVNQQWDTLSVFLTKGMDDLSWRVSRLQAQDKGRITTVADTQNYDLSLYPIPRAESVPEALWEIVNSPIFKIEELTLEAVNARAYRIADAGDSDGWRMHFGVLYGDVLVEVTTKGVTPDQLFNLLSELAAH